MVQVDRGEHLRSGEWLDLNRAYWEAQDAEGPGERAGEPLAPGSRLLHLQCGGGERTLALAGPDVQVIGVDFSMQAVRRARARAIERGLTDRSRFLCANVYDLRHMLPEPDSFDRVLTSRSALTWLPDLEEWARIVEWFLAPLGSLRVDPDAGRPVVDADVRRWSPSAEDVIEALRATGLTVADPGDGSVGITASKTP
ncbi:Methyltransferase domain-containing protein [Rathayibacter oskolensis]|uniref:Methyltransferase domain-containing protein n=1 Tax=Rathayibacter oskolensis TaxID=1891671 RepID=A0A1X7P7M6_9MICO|nr:methyltransferase domain-containing protein [Rathayibacter oskolensis]SMH46812.1 Methyltransferase domain-containing protein [Rathayibacter oskolensis]